MILKGSTTNSIGHAGRLATHLLNDLDNDQVRVVEISGPQTDDPKQAMLFMHGAVNLTKGHQGLFQVSISPEKGQEMSAEQWQDAVKRIEAEFKLEGQDKVIVEHIKKGRIHMHGVWQRTDFETETVIPLQTKWKKKLKDMGREMEVAYGHRIVNDHSPSPHFDQGAHRQAKRLQEKDERALDPKQRSAFIREKWKASKSADEFIQNLKHNGIEVAEGNKSRFVLLSASGEILKGTLGRHLRVPGERAVPAAELNKWAEGLSNPLEKVEAVQEHLKATVEQERKQHETSDGRAEVWDRDRYNQEQDALIDQAGIDHSEKAGNGQEKKKQETSNGHAEGFDRDKYNQEQDARISQAGIDFSEAAGEGEEETEGEGDAGDMREHTPRSQPVHLRQDFMDKSMEYDSAAEHYDELDRIEAERQKQLALRKKKRRVIKDDYKSAAQENDERQAKLEEGDRLRLKKEADLEDYYKTNEKRGELASLKAELAKYQGVRGKVQRGKKEELERDIAALQMTLKDIERYTQFENARLDKQIEKSREERENRETPSPANDLESLKEKRREAARQGKFRDRNKDQSRGYDI